MHRPTIYKTRSRGCWIHCICGWRSAVWLAIHGAHLEFGRHLLAARQPTTHPDPNGAPDHA